MIVFLLIVIAVAVVIIAANSNRQRRAVEQADLETEMKQHVEQHPGLSPTVTALIEKGERVRAMAAHMQSTQCSAEVAKARINAVAK